MSGSMPAVKSYSPSQVPKSDQRRSPSKAVSGPKPKKPFTDKSEALIRNLYFEQKLSIRAVQRRTGFTNWQVRSVLGKVGQPTLRQLANHVSGLPGYTWDQRSADDPEYSIAAAIERFGYLKHEPGTRHSYSNLGYGVLGHVIATRARKPLEDFLQEELFEPLGPSLGSYSVATE